jgi:hypothetical protein
MSDEILHIVGSLDRPGQQLKSWVDRCYKTLPSVGSYTRRHLGDP